MLSHCFRKPFPGSCILAQTDASSGVEAGNNQANRITWSTSATPEPDAHQICFTDLPYKPGLPAAGPHVQPLKMKWIADELPCIFQSNVGCRLSLKGMAACLICQIRGPKDIYQSIAVSPNPMLSVACLYGNN